MNAFDNRAWLVDLDGTLYHALPMRLAMLCELALFGRGSIATIRQFRRAQEEMRTSDEQHFPSPFAGQLERTASRLDVPVASVQEIVECWMFERPRKWLWTFRRRALLGQIKKFRANGGRTALVSDYPARMKLKALRAEALFDVVIASGEPGGPVRLKPWPDGFMAAAKALEVEPSECLVVGDRPDTDGLAANRAGIGFWLAGDAPDQAVAKV